MSSQFGYIDIENDEIVKYLKDVKKKEGICRILPRGRFSLRRNGEPMYDGLICSDKMGGEQTGVGAIGCRNCIKK